jgi:4-diphosphocytidyl-2-C-methyl-D-erythritol kinase
MRVRAFAKINLSLHVLGARSDGYHELRTIFQSIALHDTLTFTATRGALQLTCADPAFPPGENNLIWQAAAVMWKAAGRRGDPRGLSIDVRKRIPMAGGLGGGSTDAAATLRALARLWRVGEATVRDAAAALGADVPFFLEGGTVLGLNRGDLLFPLIDRPAQWVVLVFPAFGVSTVQAFAWFDQRAVAAEPRVRRRADTVGPYGTGNDLEAPVVAQHPEIGRIISALKRLGASDAAMSGSGSTVFGLFSSRTKAARAAARMASASRRAVLTKTLNRQRYQRLAGT